MEIPVPHDITENTKVGLFAALGVIPLLVFAVFFIAMIYFRIEAAEARIDRQASAIIEQRQMLIDIKSDLAALKAILERIERK